MNHLLGMFRYTGNSLGIAFAGTIFAHFAYAIQNHVKMVLVLIKEFIMEDIEKLIKTSMIEIERLISTKTVVGEAINIEGNTIIPLISVGFGFGAGGGSGKSEKTAKGEGGIAGTGGFGGIRPIAVIVVNKDGVQVETIRGSAASAIEKAGGAIARVFDRRGEKQKEE